MYLNRKRVEASLRGLHDASATIFGSSSHHFLLNAPLTVEQVADFEAQHNVRLPSDYRHFLIAIGNGGAGPSYGVFRLGTMNDPSYNVGNWREEVGSLAELFPFRVEDGFATASTSNERFVIGPEGYRIKAHDSSYWKDFDDCPWYSAPINGATPISHRGCGWIDWLVLSGSHAGQVWTDLRPGGIGFEPVLANDGTIHTFASWYEEWLDRNLRETGI